MLTPPVLMLLLSLQLAIGALIAASSQPWTLLFGPTILGAVFLAYQLSGSRLWSRRRCLWLIILFGSILLLPASGFLYANARLQPPIGNRLSSMPGRRVKLEAEVVAVLPAKAGRQVRVICRVSSFSTSQVTKRRNCTETTLLMVRNDSAVLRKLLRKTRISCFCYVAGLETLQHRGRSGYFNYLKRQGIWSICYLREDRLVVSSEETGSSSRLLIFDQVFDRIELIRARLITAHTDNLGTPTGPLLTAMVLGEKAVGLDAELLTSFRNVGLSHILAASGFNLTVVTFSIHWLCRLLSVPKIPANFLCFSMMTIFVLFAGNSASVVRASLMCALALAADSLGRRVHLAGLLGAALLISVLADPLSVADPGFQLSYAALCGIVFVVSPISSFLKNVVEKSWIVWALECVLTVLAAQACVLPLQLFYFKQIGLMFLPANLLASLMVTPITVAGFASSLALIVCCEVSLLQPFLLCICGVLDWFSALPLNLLINSVRYLASFHWAIVTVAPVAIWQVLLYYLILVVISACLIEQIQKRSYSKTRGRSTAN